MKIALSPLLKNSLNFESYKFVLLRPNFKKGEGDKRCSFFENYSHAAYGGVLVGCFLLQTYTHC